MQVDFTFQLLKRFYPEMLTQSLRGAVKSFIKETNLNTYKCLCQIYDFIESTDPNNRADLQSFAQEMRMIVDEASRSLHAEGEGILSALNNAYDGQGKFWMQHAPRIGYVSPYFGIGGPEHGAVTHWSNEADLFGLIPMPIPYQAFKAQLSQQVGR